MPQHVIELARATRAAAITLRRARTLLTQLAAGVRDQSASAYVYQYLELRGYGRSALARAKTIQLSEQQDHLPALESVAALFRHLTELERALAEAEALSGRFLVESVLTELIMRAEDTAALRRLVAAAEVKPLVLPIVAESELMEFSNAILARSGARLVWSELRQLPGAEGAQAWADDVRELAEKRDYASHEFKKQDQRFWEQIGESADDHPAVWETRDHILGAFFGSGEHRLVDSPLLAGELFRGQFTADEMPWASRPPNPNLHF